MKSKLIILSLVVAALSAALLVPADAGNGGDLTVYFTRHAEKETTVVAVGQTGFYTTGAMDVALREGDNNPIGEALEEVCGTTNCAEELNAEGLLRADLLADYFDQKGVVKKLDAVFATHKLRTEQTVTPTADLAGLSVQTFPVEDSSGDPATELNPQGTSASECPTLEAIFRAQDDGLDTILVAGHSGTLYDIMGSGVKNCFIQGLGLDISDGDRFPADDEGKVANFGEVWEITIKKDGTVKFGSRLKLEPVKLVVTERAN